jgi:hypothetical protein
MRVGFYLSLFISLAAGCGASDPRIQVLDAAINRSQLLLLVQTSTQKLHPLQGEIDTNVRRYLVRYKLIEPSTTPSYEDIAQIECPTDISTIERVIIGSSGSRIIRVFDISTVLIAGRAYAQASIEVIGRKESGTRLIVLKSWERQPLFLSSCGMRLLLGASSPTAYDLETMQRLNISGLRKMFSVIGSFFTDEVRVPSSVEYDDPPDYMGLTSDISYGSADAGSIYTGFIYDRESDRWSSIAREIVLPGRVGGRARAVEVQKAHGQWEILYEQPAQNGYRFFITTEQGRVLQESPPVPDHTMKRRWNAGDSTLLWWNGDPTLNKEGLRLQLWLYGSSHAQGSLHRVDLAALFVLVGDQYILKSYRP